MVMKIFSAASNITSDPGDGFLDKLLELLRDPAKMQQTWDISPDLGPLYQLQRFSKDGLKWLEEEGNGLGEGDLHRAKEFNKIIQEEFGLPGLSEEEIRGLAAQEAKVRGVNQALGNKIKNADGRLLQEVVDKIEQDRLPKVKVNPGDGGGEVLEQGTTGPGRDSTIQTPVILPPPIT